MRRWPWFQGINPYEYRKQQRLAVRTTAQHTFEAVFNQWVEFRRLSLRDDRQSMLSQILRILNKDILLSLGGRPVYDINRHDLPDLPSRIEQRKALTTAEKCRTWFNQLNPTDLGPAEYRSQTSLAITSPGYGYNLTHGQYMPRVW
ncbi:phage integrase central domain-containing protein [Pseudomonas triticifolii]|uniref:phage integrase central domain-containing protein n=1 Tax=Pseudomonas triticifolii TaxID=2762592 RepID=UPI0038B68DEE